MRVAIPLLTTLVLCGCLRSELVVCDDGRACPVGTACDSIHHGCVAPDQLTACDGLADLDDCTAVANGRCFDGVCLPRGCGNGQVEPEELCDDSNTLSGDGCSGDCVSREVCGDGYVDRQRGEECDDSNRKANDGCTSGCRREAYTLWEPAYKYPMLATLVVATDPLRGVVIGVSDNGLGELDVWEWNGSSWTRKAAQGPPIRSGYSLAFDSKRRRLVFFGGGSLNTYQNDVWEWDGVAWTRSLPLQVPAERGSALLGWDPVGQRIVLFGGRNSDGNLHDTWTWDGEAWTSVASTGTIELPSGAVAMTTDASRDRLLLVSANGVWTFEGNNAWVKLATSGMPANVSRAAYDAKRGRIVATAGTTTLDTFELVGTNWLKLSPANRPEDAAMGYEPVRERIVSFVDSSSSNLGAVKEWTGSNWVTRDPTPNPPEEQSSACAYDRVRGVVVVSGGLTMTSTWEWNGLGWALIDPLNAEPGAVTAFDRTRQTVIRYGGSGTSEWIGGKWQSLGITSPSPRSGAGIAAMRTGTILFGGLKTVEMNETWRFDGTAWTQLAPAASPPARTLAKLAYDEARDRVVLFGGEVSGSALADTWEFDGTTWTRIATTNAPAARSDHVLVYDERLARVLMLGHGVSPAIWEWDGADWHQLATSLPFSRGFPCAAYDAARGETVVFGGKVGINSTDQFLTMAYRGADQETCRMGADLDHDGQAGCDDADCAAVCTPLCTTSPCDPAAPHCGDGACSSVEDRYSCPGDCGQPDACGDAVCAPGESCLGDC